MKSILFCIAIFISNVSANKICFDQADSCITIFDLDLDYTKAEKVYYDEIQPSNFPHFWTKKPVLPYKTSSLNGSYVIEDKKPSEDYILAPILKLRIDEGAITEKLTFRFLHFNKKGIEVPENFAADDECSSQLFQSRTSMSQKMDASRDENHLVVDLSESDGFDMDSGFELQRNHICLCKETRCKFIGGSDENNLQVIVQKPEIDNLPVSISMVIILLMLSGLFSGLNLGLMALDPTELKTLKDVGDEKEKKWAETIEPVRSRGNFLLCTLLLGNTLVNSTLAIFLTDLMEGPIAVIASTFGIVVFGEIIPQSICSRHGLRVGALTLPLTKLFMILTFPLSWPISKILDKVLGAEIGAVIKKKALLQMLKLTEQENDFEEDEMQMIEGALALSHTEVKTVMTKINSSFLIDVDSVLNFDTIAEIIETGFTRIPVYEDQRTNITGMLFVRDLAFVDPDDNSPLKTIINFYHREVKFVPLDKKLDDLLDYFRQTGHHLAVVYDPEETQKSTREDGSVTEQHYAVGIVTLEDVIEELIKGEIIDETDRYVDNEQKQLRTDRHEDGLDYSRFKLADGDDETKKLTPQLLLATHRFLVTEVSVFKSLKSDSVLKLLRDPTLTIEVTEASLERMSSKEKEEAMTIMEFNKPQNFFIIILEGFCEVRVGKDAMKFDNGPFNFFGHKALQNCLNTETLQLKAGLTNFDNSEISNMKNPTGGSLIKKTIADFVPDFSLRMKEGEDRLLYLKITRQRFIQAINKDNENLNRLMTATQVQPQTIRSNTMQNPESKPKIPSTSAVAVIGSQLPSPRDRTASDRKGAILNELNNASNSTPNLAMTNEIAPLVKKVDRNESKS